jgi:four helix bundle protein
MRDHTNLIVWRKAREVALGCISLARTAWKPHSSAVIDQLTKAAVSVQLNIAEGYALWTTPKKRQHWRTAYGSAVEAVECLELLRDSKAIPAPECDRLISLGREVSRMLLVMVRKRQGE